MENRKKEYIAEFDELGFYAPKKIQELARCGECRFWDKFPADTVYPNYHWCKWYRCIKTTEIDFCRHGDKGDGRPVSD